MVENKEELSFTGERIIPELENYFFKEHLARYKLVTRYLNNNQVLLDFGCGNGYGTYYLSSYVKNSVGVDISEAAILNATKLYKKGNLHYNAINDDLWPYRQEFDIITCFEVFEHVDEPERILDKIKVSLKNSGLLFISTPNIDVFGEKLKIPFHVKEYTLKEFVEILSKYFYIEEIFGQRHKKPWLKNWNFWISRLAMRFPFILKAYNWYISKKSKKYLEQNYFEEMDTKDNYFSVEQPENADYFFIVCKNK